MRHNCTVYTSHRAINDMMQRADLISADTFFVSKRDIPFESESEIAVERLLYLADQLETEEILVIKIECDGKKILREGVKTIIKTGI